MTKKIVCGLECYFDQYEDQLEVWIGNQEYLGMAKDEEDAISMVRSYLKGKISQTG